MTKPSRLPLLLALASLVATLLLGAPQALEASLSLRDRWYQMK